MVSIFAMCFLFIQDFKAPQLSKLSSQSQHVLLLNIGIVVIDVVQKICDSNIVGNITWPTQVWPYVCHVLLCLCYT